jgi:hypothetical protein
MERSRSNSSSRSTALSTSRRKSEMMVRAASSLLAFSPALASESRVSAATIRYEHHAAISA